MYKERLHFISPDLPYYFDKFSLIDQLYYDSFALKRIRELINKKNSYLYPGYPSYSEVNVAFALKVPIYTGDSLKRYAFSLNKGAN